MKDVVPIIGIGKRICFLASIIVLSGCLWNSDDQRDPSETEDTIDRGEPISNNSCAQYSQEQLEKAFQLLEDLTLISPDTDHCDNYTITIEDLNSFFILKFIESEVSYDESLTYVTMPFHNGKIILNKDTNEVTYYVSQ